MARRRTPKVPTIAIIAVAAIVIIVGAIIALKALGGSGSVDAPITQQPDTSNDQGSSTSTTPPANATQQEVPDEAATDQPDTPAVDPATVATIDIEPMGLAVPYVRGLPGGFEFSVQRTPSGTRYVEFSNSALIGTKCTNDIGVFASIIQSPSRDDASVIGQRVTVDGTEYGLSLAEDTCTSDEVLLAKYQQSFNDAFPLLKKID